MSLLTWPLFDEYFNDNIMMNIIINNRNDLINFIIHQTASNQREFSNKLGDEAQLTSNYQTIYPINKTNTKLITLNKYSRKLQYIFQSLTNHNWLSSYLFLFINYLFQLTMKIQMI